LRGSKIQKKYLRKKSLLLKKPQKLLKLLHQEDSSWEDRLHLSTWLACPHNTVTHNLVMNTMDHHLVTNTMDHHLVLITVNHHLVMSTMDHHLVMSTMDHHLVMVNITHHKATQVNIQIR
jgi:hypothetical protein